jgi:hypothetical protein
MTYLHRNGETDPPTEPGYYWFSFGWRNKTSDTVKGGLVASVYISAANALAVALMYSDVRYSQDQLDGRWWGPVTPPWEQTT